jgi:hypothetical protein
MRFAAPLGALTAVLAACASAPADDEPLSRACTRTNCFFERNVRDFEVIDQNTLILYVGAQRCPFVVEVDGMFCDLTFSPTLRFTGGSDRICAFDRTVVDDDLFGRPEERCRIRDVRSITDTELVEILVDRGVVAPPAPVGSGQIRVEEPLPSEAAGAGSEEESSAEGEGADEQEGAATGSALERD